MAAFVVAIFAVLGFTIGYAIFGTPAGGVGALALLRSAIGSIIRHRHLFQGDKLVLR